MAKKKKKEVKKPLLKVAEKPKGKSYEHLNIFQKLQKARVLLQEKKIAKSGYNENEDFWYFQLNDFLPFINEINEMLGLYAKCDFTREVATIKIMNMDNMEQEDTTSFPMSGANIEGATQVQNLGASVTYLRRYMYMTVYEISDNDEIDATKFKKKKAAAAAKNDELTPESEQWPQAVSIYKESGKIDFIKKHYNLSEENENKLIEAAKAA